MRKSIVLFTPVTTLRDPGFKSQWGHIVIVNCYYPDMGEWTEA